MKILAIDPGKTSGFVFLTIDTDDAASLPQLMEAWEQPTEISARFVHWFLGLLKTIRPEVTVLEDYRVYESRDRKSVV